MVANADYSGIVYYAFQPVYMDPNPFLDPFITGSGGNPSGWTSAEYAFQLARANATINPAERMAKLARCERLLLSAMPVLPLCHDTWCYLQKPYVQGLSSNPFDIRAFKYAWIDTQWRPS
jgi:ABC-type oligopeptide transport system substrate-binding subunit